MPVIGLEGRPRLKIDAATDGLVRWGISREGQVAMVGGCLQTDHNLVF